MNNHDFSRFRHVFCDSLEAIRYARRCNLPKTARIFSASPAVLLSGTTGVEPEPVSEDTLNDYWYQAGHLASSLFAHWRDAGKDHDQALIAARVSVVVHHQLTRALCLAEADFKEPRLYLAAQTGQLALDHRLEAIWPVLLQGNPDFQRIAVPHEIVPKIGTAIPSLRQRLVLSGFADIGFRLVERFWRSRSIKNRPVALVFHDSEFVKEAAFGLVRHGYALRTMSAKHTIGESLKLEAIPARLLQPFDTFLKTHFTPSVMAPALAHFNSVLSRALAEYDVGLQYWERKLPGLVGTKNSVVLTTVTNAPSAIAAARIAQTLSVPVVGFQHGVTREIAGSHKALTCNFENTATNLFMTFNPEATRISNDTPFNRAQIHTVGMPAVYRRMQRSSGEDRAHPLLYVSTMLPVGNVNHASGGVSDLEKTRREISLVRNVFGQLPHGVKYKPYPARDCYVDGDPVLEAISKEPGITVFDQDIDLRYIAHHHKVIITARATSTVSWCLLTGLPVVFINHPTHAPLREEYRQAFADSLFLFDWDDPDMHQTLRAFLSQPIKDIEQQYAAKKNARQELLDQAISGPKGNAGRRAVDIILAQVSKGAAS